MSSLAPVFVADPNAGSQEPTPAGKRRDFFRVEDAPNSAGRIAIIGSGVSATLASLAFGDTSRGARYIDQFAAYAHEVSQLREPDHILDDLTLPVVRALQRRARNAVTIRAEFFFEQLRMQLRTLPLVRGKLSPLQAVELDDGGFAIEWILDTDRRLVFAFESVEENSGWHFVSSKSSGGIRAYGDFSGLELRPLLAWALASNL